MAPTIDLIVNPASGPPSRRLARDQRLAHAVHLLEALGAVVVRGTMTRARGDGSRAARRAVDAAVDTVVVWGGDGTLHEVAAQLIGSGTTLAVVPGGSGNGLARALGLPLSFEAALRIAVHGATARIDVGLANGTPFFNLAGFGLDASVAQRFNEIGGTRRGMATYLRCCVSELRAHVPGHYRVSLDGVDWFDGAAHLVAIANGQQYGHGARIAPLARLDDGWFDVAVLRDVSISRTLRYGWRLFHGSIDKVPGVLAGKAKQVRVSGVPGALLHADGEILPATAAQEFTLQPRALSVRVPPGFATDDDAAAATPETASPSR